MPNAISYAPAVFCLAVLLGATAPATQAFDIIEITDNNSDDRRPAISGSKFVWQGHEAGDKYSDWEIYLNGSQLTNDVLAVSALRGRMNANPRNGTD